MDGNGWMQPGGRLPGLEADSGNRLAGATRFGHRHPPSVAGDNVAAFDKAGRLDLQPLDGAIDITHGAAGGGFLAENVPGLQGLTQFQRNAAMMDPAERGKTEF